jgi:hypothetical protein
MCFAATAYMSRAVPQYTRTQVDAAGSTLAKGLSVEDYDPDDEAVVEYERALEIINNWRSSHSFPLNTFQVGLKKARPRSRQRCTRCTTH